MERESFSSRLGFILISAGCAIGLGNVWRFPFVTGQYGGASFVLIYLCFLLLLGLPIMVAEFAVGRASRHSPAKSFDTLEPKGTKWHLFKYVTIAGNIILMMFYTTVSGWMLYFLYKMAVGDLSGLDAQGIKGVFGALLQDPATMAGNMAIIIMLCFGVCYMGVRNGVERITKVMMAFLIVLMVVLAANSMLLPGSEAGLKYYLYPDFDKIAEHGVREVIFAAMGQAFFTLLPGADSGKLHETTTEKVIDMVFMHIGTYIAVVSMAQDGQIIEKHVRSLETQLIEPPILGNDKLQIVLRHIIVCFHAQDIVCCKTWHRHTSFLLDSCSSSYYIFYHKQL